MRRILALLTLALAASACATPPITLSARYEPGDSRVYRLTATASTTIVVGDERIVERSELRARSTITVLGSLPDGARLRLVVEPESFERNGTPETREPQEVVLVVATDGTVRSVETVEGLPVDIASGADELAPLLGIPLPQGRLRLGERWRRDLPLPDGAIIEQTGRIAGLRVEQGYDAAIVRLGTTRPLRRERVVDQTRITLAGTEFAAVEVAFALAGGFPVRIDTDAEGRFSIVGAPEGGGVTTRTRSVMTLVEAGA